MSSEASTRDGTLPSPTSYPIHMDWRSRLRKLVNREDYLTPWRRALMRIVDPVEWYMRKDDQENGRPGPYRLRRQPGVGGTMYAPLEEQPPDLERHTATLDQARKRRDAARGALRREYGSFFEAKARELLERNEVRIEGATGRIDAKLVHFRNGAVFECAVTSSTATGHEMRRMDLAKVADGVPILTACLQKAALALGPDPGSLK